MRPDRLDIALSALPCRGPRRHLRMGTTTQPQAETNACGATGSRKGSETRQMGAGGVDRGWSGKARPCETCALCEGTDETALTEAEADARGDEAVVWSPPHADAVCDQSSHADKRGGQGLSGVSPLSCFIRKGASRPSSTSYAITRTMPTTTSGISAARLPTQRRQ